MDNKSWIITIIIMGMLIGLLIYGIPKSSKSGESLLSPVPYLRYFDSDGPVFSDQF